MICADMVYADVAQFMTIVECNETIVGRAAGYKSAGKSHADVAQLAEQLICNQQVIGSSPIIGFFEGTRVLEQGPLAQLVRATGS